MRQAAGTPSVHLHLSILAVCGEFCISSSSSRDFYLMVLLLPATGKQSQSREKPMAVEVVCVVALDYPTLATRWRLDFAHLGDVTPGSSSLNVGKGRVYL